MKPKVNLNLAPDVHQVLVEISGAAGRSQVGARGPRRRISASRYVEQLVRAREAEWRFALEYLERAGWHRSGLALACQALDVAAAANGVWPALVASQVRQVRQDEVSPARWAALVAGLEHPGNAGALATLAQEWGLDNPRLQRELVGAEGAATVTPLARAA